MLDQSSQQRFANDGYCRLPGLVPAPVLERLRRTFDLLLVPDRVPGKAIRLSPDGPVVTNVGNLIGWGCPAILELLALPEIMNVAASICGDDLFLVQEFAVIKHRGDDNPVLWHQDMVHSRSGPAMAMGIYLDDAPAGQGALRYVPGSHLGAEPICDLARQPAVEVPAQAGDVIIHDMMVAHSSEPMDGNTIRRVIYLEFVSSDLARADAIYPQEVIDNRKRLLFAARRYRRETSPGGNCYKPRQRDPSPRDKRRPLGELLAEIYSLPTNPRPATYCFDRIPANLG